MFLIANLVTYYEMKKRAAEYGMSSDMLAKNDLVIDGGLRSLEICKRAGVPVAYGTDLLGQLQSEQSREFLIRSEVQKPIEIIRAATLIGAQIVRQVGKLGCLKPGAFADLLVIDGNPLADLGVLQEQGKYLAVIMKGGRFHEPAELNDPPQGPAQTATGARARTTAGAEGAQMKSTSALKQIVARRAAVQAPGTANALFARVIEELGFEVVYVTGAGIANCIWAHLTSASPR